MTDILKSTKIGGHLLYLKITLGGEVDGRVLSFQLRLFEVFFEALENSKLKGGKNPFVAAKESAADFIDEERKKGRVYVSEETNKAADSAESAYHSLDKLLHLEEKFPVKTSMCEEAIKAHTVVIHSFLKGQKTSDASRTARGIEIKMIQSLFESQ